MKITWRSSLVALLLSNVVLSGGCGGGGHGSSVAANAVDERDTSRIISASLPLCKAGVPYQSNSAAGTPAAVVVKDGSTSYAFSLSSGSLPEGLTLDGSGVVSGTTDAPPGRYAFTMRVVDRDDPSFTFTQPMTILVVRPGQGTQPFEAIEQNPRAYYVHQDAGMCGPAAFYMILKYLGDIQPGAGPTNADLSEVIPRDGAVVVASTSKVSAYLSSLSSSLLPGTDWQELEDGATTLRRDYEAFYPCVQSNTDYSGNDDAGAAARLKIFTDDLVPFLRTNSPVLIHLRRPYGISGHYVVVIGYDPGTNRVLYFDPYDARFDPRAEGYDPESLDWPEAVRKVSREAFIGQAWYQRSGYLDAWWDGRWLGFTH